MKKFLLVAVVLVVGVVAGIFFLDTSPHVPLAAEIVGVTNVPTGGLTILCRITNTTCQPYAFRTSVQRLSNGAWESQTILVTGTRTSNVITPWSSTQVAMWSYQTSGVIRVAILFGKAKTQRQNRIDLWLRKYHLGPIFNDPIGGQMFTTPTNFPAR